MTNEERMALIYLVRRETQYSGFTWWYFINPDDNLVCRYQCCLCSEIFYSNLQIEEHGILHLKEHNLLPFI